MIEWAQDMMAGLTLDEVLLILGVWFLASFIGILIMIFLIRR